MSKIGSGLGALAACACVILTTQVVERGSPVRTTRLEIIDSKGALRAMMSGEDENSSVFVLYRPGTKEPRLQMLCEASGTSHLKVIGDDGRVRCALVIDPVGDTPSSLALVDKTGSHSVGLTTFDGRGAAVEIGKADKEVCVLRAQNGRGSLEVHDESGKITFTTPK